MNADLMDFNGLLVKLRDCHDEEIKRLQKKTEECNQLQSENAKLKETLLTQQEEHKNSIQKLEKKIGELNKKNEFYMKFIEQYNRKWQVVNKLYKLPEELITEISDQSHLLLKNKSPPSPMESTSISNKASKLRINKTKKHTRYTSESTVTMGQSSSDEERLKTSPKQKPNFVKSLPVNAKDTTDYSAISPPSLTSTPLPTNSDNDITMDFKPLAPSESKTTVTNVPLSVATLDPTGYRTTPKVFCTLPPSDSQFPVDLSYTQPGSPVLPTRGHGSGVNVSDIPSPSLIPEKDDGVVRNLSESFNDCENTFEVKKPKDLKQGKKQLSLGLRKSSQEAQPEKKRKRGFDEQEELQVCKKQDFGEPLSPPSHDDKENGGTFEDSFRSPADRETDMLDQIPGTPQGDTKSSRGPTFKYVEVVRGREERAKLNGYTCRECEKYYECLGLGEEEKKLRLKECSKHRTRFVPPPDTPPDFWKMSFYETQEYKEKRFLRTEEDLPKMYKQNQKEKGKNKYSALVKGFDKKGVTSEG